MIPDELEQRWESAYRQYVDTASTTETASAQVMASVSSSLARAWREIAEVPGLPWWMVAAASTAAESFEAQAREWAARGGSGGVRHGRRGWLGRGE